MSSKVVTAIYVGDFRETVRSYEYFGITVDVGFTGSAKHTIGIAPIKIDTGITRYQTFVTSSINFVNMTVFKVYEGVVNAVSGNLDYRWHRFRLQFFPQRLFCRRRTPA